VKARRKPMSQPEPVVWQAGEGPTIEGPAGGPLTLKVRGEHTGGSVTAFENIIAPGDGPPLHTHTNEDEAWYVIEGRLRFHLGDELAEVSTGGFVFVPRSTLHCIQNAGAEPARILVLFTTAGMEGFFDRLAALPPGAVDPDAFPTRGAKVGMEVVGPPLGRGTE
jgi:quercetin dioxygenase-like cupin family protein